MKKENERLGGGKKFIRSNLNVKIFKKSGMIDDNNNDLNSN